MMPNQTAAYKIGQWVALKTSGEQGVISEIDRAHGEPRYRLNWPSTLVHEWHVYHQESTLCPANDDEYEGPADFADATAPDAGAGDADEVSRLRAVADTALRFSDAFWPGGDDRDWQADMHGQFQAEVDAFQDALAALGEQEAPHD